MTMPTRNGAKPSTALRPAAGADRKRPALVPSEPAPAQRIAWGPRPSDKPKTRRCLRCGTEFASQWSGERICGRCKGSAVWREGGLGSSHLTSDRR